MSAKRNKNFTLSYSSNWTLPIAPRFAFVVCLIILMLGVQSSAQTVTDLYDFTGGSDGWYPNAPTAGPDGTLYGTTQQGGLFNSKNCSTGCGTVYRLTPSGGQWTESTLYKFSGGRDGDGFSATTFALDTAGKLYGVSDAFPYGGIYRLTPGAPGKPWHFGLLHQFKDERDGGNPVSPIFLDNSGAIYAASSIGGLSGCFQQQGCGNIVQLNPPTHKNSPWTVQPLYEFQGASDGGNPTSIFMDRTGTIFGTTAYGGDFNKNCPLGCGVVFELFPVNGTWAYKVLYSFHGAPHQSPSGLIGDASGNLYGFVGATNCCGGDIFQLAPPAGGNGPWTFTYIHLFHQNYPTTYLTLGPNGTFYGDIYGDQDFNWGYIFHMIPPSQQGGAWTYTTLVNFNPLPYQNPSGIVVGLQGYIYGALSGGGYFPGNIVSVAP